MAGHMEEYDAIAKEYRDSKQLPFREHVERHTLFQLIGDIRGKTVLDVACGEGMYTRLLKRAGASEVTGVDISGAMIRLAEDEERRHPLGCKYAQADVAAFKPSGPVDLVVAMYLLNYARSGEQLRRFCQVCRDALRPGGRFAGVNDNVRNLQSGGASLKKYGLERLCPDSPAEGDTIRYIVTNADGREFEFNNYYLTPETYEDAFQKTGFRGFRWVNLSLHPSQRGNSFWNEFMNNPPIVAFEASR